MHNFHSVNTLSIHDEGRKMKDRNRVLRVILAISPAFSGSLEIFAAYAVFAGLVFIISEMR